MVRHLILFGLISILPTANALHVVIDPGHGGRDLGAQAQGLREAHLTLEISRKIESKLLAAKYAVSLTRREDRSVSLSERAQFAREQKADVLLSIHLNSSEDKRAQGLEVYFQNQLPPDEASLIQANRENGSGEIGRNDYVESLAGFNLLRPGSPELQEILRDLVRHQRILSSSELAMSIRESWQGNARPKVNSLRQAPFFVVSQVNMPSALVELGYLTHPKEGPLLADKDYQEIIADSLLAALSRFKEEVDKVATRP